MTGFIGWTNRCTESGVTYTELNSAAYSSSSPNNVGTKHLYDNYKVDGATDQAVLQIDLASTYTERMAVALCGVASSAGVKSTATYTVTLKEGTATREAISVNAIDKHEGTIIALASASYAIDRVEVAIAANGGETWLGFGSVWAGPGIILERNQDMMERPQGSPVAHRNNDWSTDTPGGQNYGTANRRLRALSLSVFAGGSSSLKRGEVNQIASLYDQVGSTGRVIATAAENESSRSVYGILTSQGAAVSQAITDEWMNQLSVEERF